MSKQTDWKNTKIIDATSAPARYGTASLASSSMPPVPASATPKANDKSDEIKVVDTE